VKISNCAGGFPPALFVLTMYSKMRWFKLILCFFCFSTSAFSQNFAARSEAPSTQGEMRAVWITSVSNLDWPKPGDRNNIDAQKASLIAYLETLQSLNMNAALLQVRPECDALYQSSYEPWSRYLTGTQGTDPGYDPLQFAIEEAHKRGIELHAWLNPYRINASKSAGDSYYDEEHVYKEHPEWALAYDDGGKILNPGLPQVQEYIKEVVGDIISNYDVDGIHFDDYFYSYSGTPTALDQDTYNTYGAAYNTIGDFRRGSINNMIEAVWDTIQSVKPYVRFGVSPFGIYGNGMNPAGISGLNAYSVIYCDPLAWLEAGTVDYITPQLYWPTGGSQDYATLLPWWADQVNANDRHVYAGQGIYRLGDNSPVARNNEPLHEMKAYFNMEESSQRIAADPWTLDQIVRQVEINRAESAKGALGSVYFRMEDFTRVNGLFDYLKQEVYQNLTLVPEITWKTSATPTAPTNLRLGQVNGQSVFSLLWDQTDTDLRAVIYTVDPTADPSSFTSDINRQVISYTDNFDLSTLTIPQGQSIIITSLNRYGKESVPSTLFQVSAPVKGDLLLPQNSAINVESTDDLAWTSIPLASSYTVELATDDLFTENPQQISVSDTIIQIDEIPLQGETTYYWRMAGENFGGTGIFSDVFTFDTGFPQDIAITAPTQNATLIPLHPTLKWNATEASDSIQMQLSEGGNTFAPNNLFAEFFVKNNSAGSYDLEQSLKAFTTYYLRMRSFNAFGYSAWTDIVQFKTLFPTPIAPTISTPIEGAEFTTEEVTIAWTSPPTATSYLLQIALDENFTALVLDQRVFDALDYVFTGDVKDSTYYIRIAGRNPGGFGEWSEARTFRLIDEMVTSVQQPDAYKIVAFPNPVMKTLTIRTELDIALDDIMIYNAFGVEFPTKMVKTGVSEYQIDLGAQQCAPCLIRIKAGDTYQTIKVVSAQ
jgi:uncharacterized lipoprotein YddW (UPF0748 family)